MLRHKSVTICYCIIEAMSNTAAIIVLRTDMEICIRYTDRQMR